MQAIQPTDWVDGRTVGEPYVFQDDVDRFEIVIVDESKPHAPHFVVREIHTRHETRSCFRRGVHYRGRVLSDAMDAARDRFSFIVRTKLETGRLPMRATSAIRTRQLVAENGGAR